MMMNFVSINIMPPTARNGGGMLLMTLKAPTQRPPARRHPVAYSRFSARTLIAATLLHRESLLSEFTAREIQFGEIVGLVGGRQEESQTSDGTAAAGSSDRFSDASARSVAAVVGGIRRPASERAGVQKAAPS